MKNSYLQFGILVMIIAGVATVSLSNSNNEYKQLLKMNQEAMAYYDEYETGFRGYYSDVDLDGDGINEAPSAGAYDVRGKCSRSDGECIWGCECGRLYSAKRSGESHSMTGTCFCGLPIK